MRLSVSTKIFLGFAVVIIAFGSASTYSIYRMNAHRASVAVIWQEVNPISLELRGLLRRIQAQDEFLELKKPQDAEYLQRALPTLQPFKRLQAIEEKIASLINRGLLSEADEHSLEAVQIEIRGFRQGDELYRTLQGRALETLGVTAGEGSEALYQRLIRQSVSLANSGRLHRSSPEALGTRRALRKLNHVIIGLHQMLDEQVRTLDARAADDEKVATLAVILIASGALLISLLMLFMSQWTLTPIRRLSEAVKRVAAGHYDEKVASRSTDEIGQLAHDFNRMAQSLQERDTELERQRKELLRADRFATIGKLAAQITHEVRNPLSSIGLNAELIEEEVVEAGQSDEVCQLVRAIQDEVERLKIITERYLQYTGLPQPELAPMNLAAVARDLMSFLTPELAEAHIPWEVEEAEAGLVAMVDEDQIRQVLLNLIRNAMEAFDGTSRSEKRLLVRVSVQDESHIALSVTDWGSGIDPSLIDRIFEPFVTEKHQGTGLGLALSQEVIAGHGGTIRAESPIFEDAMGEFGSTFTIELMREKSGERL